MTSLPTPLRRQLESAIQQARSLAEAGACHALEALAVQEPDPYPHMNDVQRRLRRQLCAQARRLRDQALGRKARLRSVASAAVCPLSAGKQAHIGF